jgi:hypothetical protein
MITLRPDGKRRIQGIDDAAVGNLFDAALSQGVVSGLAGEILTSNAISQSYISVDQSPTSGLIYYEMTDLALPSNEIMGYSEVQTFGSSPGFQIEDIAYYTFDNRVRENSAIISNTGIGGPNLTAATIGVYLDADSGMLIGVLNTGALNLGSRGYTKQGKYNVPMWAVIGLNPIGQSVDVNLGQRPFIHTMLASAKAFIGAQENPVVTLSPIHRSRVSTTLSNGDLTITAGPAADVVACGTKPRGTTGEFQFEHRLDVLSTRMRVGLIEAQSMEPQLNNGIQVGQLAGSIGYSPLTGDIVVNNVVVATTFTNPTAGSVTGIVYDADASTFQVKTPSGNSAAIAIPTGIYYPAESINTGGEVTMNFGATVFTNALTGLQATWQ